MTEINPSVVREVLRNLIVGQADELHQLDSTSFFALPFSAFKLDSMEKMELVMSVEERFSILLDEADVQNCKTIGEFASLVEKSVAG